MHTCDVLEVYRWSNISALVLSLCDVERELQAVLTCHLCGGERAGILASVGRGKDGGDRTELLSLLDPVCLLNTRDSRGMLANELQVGDGGAGRCPRGLRNVRHC